MPVTTTAGAFAINHGLPEDLRDHDRVLDGKAIKSLLKQVAEKYPDRYRDIAQHLLHVGRHISSMTSGMSFGLSHIRRSPRFELRKAKIEKELDAVHRDPKLSDDEKDAAVIKVLQGHGQAVTDETLHEAIAEGNPLGLQVLSNVRGNATNLRSIRSGDLLYADHRGRPIPVPILSAYSKGLTPVEYYAGSFGARHGVVGAKLSVGEAGFGAKLMTQAAHRLMVTHDDEDGEEDRRDTGDLRGLPVPTDDPDNEGALLAKDFGPFKRNTVLTPRILAQLHAAGHENLLVRSPIVGGTSSGGVYAKDVGVREYGRLPRLGDNVGVTAAQSLSEPLTQMMLGAKHKGGIADTVSAGPAPFKLVESVLGAQKAFRGSAAHAQMDGKVQAVRKAPQGGHYVTIGGEDHYVGHDYDVLVKPGQDVEAGDAISSGVPNPAEMVHHKGIGEGRHQFTNSMMKIYKDGGVKAHRRNMELLARGLIDRVELTEERGNYVPGDVVPYSQLEREWEPREGSKTVPLRSADGMYLERPVLHYSIGTRIRPSVSKRLQEFGVTHVHAHTQPAPFHPTMIRAVEHLAHDPDWMVRFMGSYLKSGLLDAAHRGLSSTTNSTSYVPGMAQAKGFSTNGPFARPKDNSPLPKAPTPAPSIMAQIADDSHSPVGFGQPAEKHASAGVEGELEKEPFASFQVTHPKGSVRDVFEPHELDFDDDTNEPLPPHGYPLLEVKHHADFGHLAGHFGDDGDELPAFRGTEPGGVAGRFSVRQPSGEHRTVFFNDMSREEYERQVREYATVMNGRPTTFRDRTALSSALKQYRRV